jgi:hypothetical protein
MADTDEPTQPRKGPGAGRRDAAQPTGPQSDARADRRRGPPLQIDAAANRITAVFPGPPSHRPEGNDSATQSPQPTQRPGAFKRKPPRPSGFLRQATATDRGNPSAAPSFPQSAHSRGAARPTASSGATDIPELELDGNIEPVPIEPFIVDPAEPPTDIAANVYIAAEQGDRRTRRGGKQRRKSRTVRNPFGMIEKGTGPKFRARIPTWQKILMGVCGVAVLAIAYVVFGTGSTKLPGWDQGVLVRTQIEFLDQQIELPYVPQTVTWQILTQEEQERYGATKLRVIAVIEFMPEQAAELIARSTPMPQLEGAEAIESHRWFPDEARDLMSDLDIDRDSTVYSADVFFDGVFQRGTMVRLGDTGYIVTKLFDY